MEERYKVVNLSSGISRPKTIKELIKNIEDNIESSSIDEHNKEKLLGALHWIKSKQVRDKK